jgi:DNA-binding transcriptional regulator GbsR (MarR family)
MTAKATADRVRSIETQLQSHEKLLHSVQSERERQHVLDRINEFKRDLERARAGKLRAQD